METTKPLIDISTHIKNEKAVLVNVCNPVNSPKTKLEDAPTVLGQ